LKIACSYILFFINKILKLIKNYYKWYDKKNQSDTELMQGKTKIAIKYPYSPIKYENTIKKEASYKSFP